MSTVKSMLIEVEKEFKAIFPQSSSMVSMGCLGDGTDNAGHSLIVCLSTKAEWGCTRHNDIVNATFWVHNPADADGKYIIESDSKSFTVHDATDRFNCRRVKTGFRKKNNTAEKNVIAMKKYFVKLHELLNSEKENIDSKYHKFM